MIKNIFNIILLIFTTFVIFSFFQTVFLFSKQKDITNKIINQYQYQYFINEKYNYLDTIIKAVEAQYQKLLKEYKFSTLRCLQNKTNEIKNILDTLNKLKYKKVSLFLLDYLQKIKKVQIDILNLNYKVIASNNLNNINKKLNKPPCNFLQNKECLINKNNTTILITYYPQYNLIMKTQTNKILKINEIKTSIIQTLKNLPNIIIYDHNKLIKGHFNKDYFYIFEEFKPLKIFIGIGINYSELEKLNRKINIEINNIIYKTILKFIFIYILIIIIFYILIFSYLKSKLKILDKNLQNLKEKTVYDKLTSLLNREGFEELFKEQNYKYFMLIDLDNFKYINDTFGHDIGDEVLKEFAWQLKKHFKEDLIGRWGGDEFIIATNKQKKEITQHFKDINKKLKEIQLKFDKNPQKILSTSVGVATNINFPLEELFKNADLALYKVKKTKKGKVLFFEDIDYIKIEKDDLK